ncbi:hypothetical protein ACLOJK_013867 [Asimina triloba]
MRLHMLIGTWKRPEEPQRLILFLSFSNLRRLSLNDALVTTFFQTNDRTLDINEAVNLTLSSNGSFIIRSPTPFSPSNDTIMSLTKTIPYNLSTFIVNLLLIPPNFDLAASKNHPSVGLNIAKALIDGKNFNVATSMLMVLGVVDEFKADDRGARITIFVIWGIAHNGALQSLLAKKKAVVLNFHVLHSYYPSGLLESIMNLVQPTLVAEDVGVKQYILNIIRINGTVAIETRIVRTSIMQTEVVEELELE